MGHVLKYLFEMLKGNGRDEKMGHPDSAQNRFTFFTSARLLLLAVVMAGLWMLAAPAGLSPEEERLWEKVRSAQLHLSQWRQDNGTVTPLENDPWRCGLIGLEWSETTTTLGALTSKQTACNPAWAVQFSRWFTELGLKPGDPVAIYSSGSFPGLLLNVIVAAEAMQLEPLLIVSLGASTWGANHPDISWPVIATELRRNGSIRKRADYYTLGGGSELGHGMPDGGEVLLRQAADDANVELLTTDNLEEMITLKVRLLETSQSRLLINIGGSQANLGDAEAVLRLQPGLVPAGHADQAGNGVIGIAMRKNIPVIHMLNVKSISERVGIPYDNPPRKQGPLHMRTGWSCLGLLLFFIVLFTHQRWRLEPAEG